MVWTSLRPCTTNSSSLRWTVDGASLQFLDRVVDIAVCSETGTHSVKLCIIDWIDMPVVVHVKVVDYPVMAQSLFLLVQCSRPQRFRCCSSLIRC